MRLFLHGGYEQKRVAEGRHLFVSAFARKGMDECKQCEFGGWESDTLR